MRITGFSNPARHNNTKKAEMAIHILDSKTISRIAAGEVADRPAGIVKELVENSLDANADYVEVELDAAARRIQVKDNGEGILPEDLKKALLCHATGKIKNADDLWGVKTYGFRGEALASIASVSDITLISKTKSGKAFRLNCAFGAMREIKETGRERGTSVIVQSLFENTPARLKFLKSQAGETFAVKNVLKAQALSKPKVTFKLLHRGQLSLYFPKQQNFMARAKEILKVDELYHAEAERGGMTFEGVFAPPHRTCKTGKEIWLFANDRHVEDRILHSALQAAYRGLLMHGERPLAAIKIYAPLGEVDVNVHPAKTQVRFKNSRAVFQLVESAVRKVLEQAPWTRSVTGRSFTFVKRPAVRQAPRERNFQFSDPVFRKTHFSKESFKPGAGRPGFEMKTAPPAGNMQERSEASHTACEMKENTAVEGLAGAAKADFRAEKISLFPAASPPPPARHPVWSSLQILAQARLTYLVCQSDRALVFIDQHAAAERILYEKLWAFWKSKHKWESQVFLTPLRLNMEEEEASALFSITSDLKKIGITLEMLGPGCVGVASGPSILKESALEDGLRFLAENFMETQDAFSFERTLSRLFASMACHSAVRAGQALSFQQMEDLLKGMDEFPLSSFCPHGRPVFVEYPISKLEKDFGRTI